MTPKQEMINRVLKAKAMLQKVGVVHPVKDFMRKYPRFAGGNYVTVRNYFYLKTVSIDFVKKIEDFAEFKRVEFL